MIVLNTRWKLLKKNLKVEFLASQWLEEHLYPMTFGLENVSDWGNY